MGTAEIVRQMRSRLNRSQAEFARLLRCTQNSVSRYESGSVPGVGVLLRLHDLGLPPEREVLAGYIKKNLGAKGKYASPNASIASLRGLIEESAVEDVFLQHIPSADLREQWEPLAELLARLVRTDRTLDDSIVEIIRLWVSHYKDRQMETLLRDAVGYLRVQWSAQEDRIRCSVAASMERVGQQVSVNTEGAPGEAENQADNQTRKD